MNRATIQKLMRSLTDERIALSERKSADYAVPYDALDNFWRMSAICDTLNINPRRSGWDCAMFLLLLKVDRWCNLHSQDKEPDNESIRDTILDAHNYIDLAYACELDDEDSSVTTYCANDTTGGVVNE